MAVTDGLAFGTKAVLDAGAADIRQVRQLTAPASRGSAGRMAGEAVSRPISVVVSLAASSLLGAV